MEELREKCGVFGVYAGDNLNVARTIFYALYALQHRGQESCGIAVDDGKRIRYSKEMGLVSENFNEETLKNLQGKIGIGHVRYSTCGSGGWINCQPIVVSYKDGMMALAHNGNLVNTRALTEEMGNEGSVFISDNDTELIVKLLARYLASEAKAEDAVKMTMAKAKGSYAITMMMPGKLIGFRIPSVFAPYAWAS